MRLMGTSYIVGWLLEATEIEGESCCVRTDQVECVAYVHEECVAPPTELVLDEGIGEFAQWSKLAAVTQMECMDHAAMVGFFGGSLWAACAAFCRKVAVSNAAIYLHCKGQL